MITKKHYDFIKKYRDHLHVWDVNKTFTGDSNCLEAIFKLNMSITGHMLCMSCQPDILLLLDRTLLLVKEYEKANSPDASAPAPQVIPTMEDLYGKSKKIIEIKTENANVETKEIGSPSHGVGAAATTDNTITSPAKRKGRKRKAETPTA